MRPRLSRRRLLAAGFAVALASVGSWLVQSGCTGESSAGGAVRGTVVRLSAASEHRPCRFEWVVGRALPGVTCAGRGETARRESVETVLEWLEDGAGKVASAHREGIALLTIGDHEAAIRRLESAVRVGQEPAARADLAGARIEGALAADDPYALIEALEELERLRDLPGGSEYNRALVLGLLNLRAPAWEAWAKVREREADRGWRSDAEWWLDRLSRPTEADRWRGSEALLLAWLRGGAGDLGRALDVAREHPQQARVLAEEEGFAAWAAFVLAGDAAAAAAAAGRLVALGEELRRVTGDALLLRAAEAVTACGETACRALAEGHAAYTRARDSHELQDYSRAEPLFAASFESLSRGETPFAVWPAFYRTVIVGHHLDLERAAWEFRELGTHPGATEPIARGYLHWMLGWVAARQSERRVAEREFTAARDLFRATGQRENEQEMESQLGSIWDALGEPRQAWRHHHRALSLLGSSVKSRRIENTLSAAANGLRWRGEYAASLVLQEACVALAKNREVENPLAVAVALRYKAQSLAGLGDERAALQAVSEGLEWAEWIPDDGLWADARMALLLTGGAVAETDLSRALDHVEAAIRFAERHQVRHLLPEAYATAAKLRGELGDPEGELRALTAAVEEIERQRRELAREEDRVGFALAARKVMEQGAVSLSERQDWEAAFTFTDRLRARALWDAMDRGSQGARELSRESLEDGEAVLSYLVLPDRVLGWWVRRDAVSGFRLATDGRELSDLVGRFRQAARAGDTATLERLQRRLSDLLLGQVRSQLDGVSRLVVVPDGPLEELPFAALEGAAGEILAENGIELTTVPAAGLYPLLRPRTTPSDADSRWLLVTDPAHSTSAFPALGPVTTGRPLAERWRRTRGGQLEVLTGDAATPAAFSRAAPVADVVIFLGHALTADEFSTRAGLVLAPGEDDDGLLSMRDVRFPAASAPRLAILAGCGTGRGRATAADGSMTLGRSFLRAGVPTVVTTLWEVDAAGAVAMTDLVLEALVEGEDDPLGTARRRAIASGVPPSVWMAFQTIGGG